MRIENDVKLDYADVLIRPKRSTLASRKDVDLIKEYNFRHGSRWEGCPIIAANMEGVGTWKMADIFKQHRMLVSLTKGERDKEHNQPPESFDNSIIPTFGITDIEFKRLGEIDTYWRCHNFICLDVANGYQEQFVNAVKLARKLYPLYTIIAGNVVTGEMTEELLLAGADIIKVGIGQGSVCTTRLVTGVGYPQLSAVIECADAAHGLGGHIIADGGIVHIGDVAKAFGAGADFVMMGSMFAGHDEGGNVKEREVGSHWVDTGRDMMQMPTYEKYVEHYGNSSDKAQGTTKSYRASEGRVTEIPYKGPVENTIQEILGGLRSACTYAGAKNLKELPKRTTFVRVNSTHNSSLEKYTVGK